MGFGIRSKTRVLKTAATMAWRFASTPKDARLRVLLLCHALEKGMGMPNPRTGFGKEKCRQLIAALFSLRDTGRAGCWEFAEGSAVLAAYLSYQEEHNVEVGDLHALSFGLLPEENPCLGGYRDVRRSDMEAGKGIDVPLLFNSKHSMRDYAPGPIDEESLLKAIALARRSPSACNRQPWKVYYTLEPSLINVIRDSLPAQAFLEAVPNFLVVTCDNTLFSMSEVCQCYVNGGIFLSYLTLALHHYGLGSIILEYNLSSKSESELRQAMHMRDEDAIIAIVGFGGYPDEAKWICADRRPTSEIVISVG